MPKTVADLINAERLPVHLRGTSLPELLTLAGRNVMVVGGGGRNLGQACVDRVASLGANVAVVDCAIQAAESISETTAERWNVKAYPFQCDMTQPAEIARTVNEATASLGGIDDLVISAGHYLVDGR